MQSCAFAPGVSLACVRSSTLNTWLSPLCSTGGHTACLILQLLSPLLPDSPPLFVWLWSGEDLQIALCQLCYLDSAVLLMVVCEDDDYFCIFIWAGGFLILNCIGFNIYL